MTDWNLKEDDVVVLRPLDDIPEHLFQVIALSPAQVRQ